jgi:hypothetical protein
MWMYIMIRMIAALGRQSRLALHQCKDYGSMSLCSGLPWIWCPSLRPFHLTMYPNHSDSTTAWTSMMKQNRIQVDELYKFCSRVKSIDINASSCPSKYHSAKSSKVVLYATSTMLYFTYQRTGTYHHFHLS